MTVTNTGAHTFTISTWADTKSNRRDRSYVVVADHANDATDEAVLLAERAIRQFGRSIYTKITDVDGKGAPVDCPHAHSILWDGFTVRADGGRDCKGECAA